MRWIIAYYLSAFNRFSSTSTYSKASTSDQKHSWEFRNDNKFNWSRKGLQRQTRIYDKQMKTINDRTIKNFVMENKLVSPLKNTSTINLSIVWKSNLNALSHR